MAVTKRAIVRISEEWCNGQHLVVATLLRGARGTLGERADAIWRVTCEGIDRGFSVGEEP